MSDPYLDGITAKTKKAEPTADQLIERFVQLRDHCAAQSKKFDEFLKPFKTEMAEIQDKLLAVINALGGKAIKTEHGTAYTSTITTPKVEDRSKYLDWLWALSDEDWARFGDAMLQVGAPQKDATTEYMQAHEGQLPPGVAISSFIRVNVNRG